MRAIGRAAPHGVIVVEGDGMALAASRYHALAPGVRIVSLRSAAGGADHWADGWFTGPHVDAAGAVALLHHEHRLFALVRGDHDPGRALKQAGAGVIVRAASGNRQPWVWVWRDQAAALSMPSSPSLR